MGLGASIAGFGLLALGIAYGRAAEGPRAGLEDRYVTIATLLPCLLGLAASRFGPAALRNVLTALLFALACGLIGPNSRIGLDAGRDRKAGTDAVVADIRAGVPLSRIVPRHDAAVGPGHDLATLHWPQLRRAGIEPFGSLVIDRLVAVPIVPDPVDLTLAQLGAGHRHPRGDRRRPLGDPRPARPPRRGACACVMHTRTPPAASAGSSSPGVGAISRVSPLGRNMPLEAADGPRPDDHRLDR